MSDEIDTPSKLWARLAALERESAELREERDQLIRERCEYCITDPELRLCIKHQALAAAKRGE